MAILNHDFGERCCLAFQINKCGYLFFLFFALTQFESKCVDLESS